MAMKVKDLIGVLQKCDPENDVKMLGEIEGVDIDVCPSVVIKHPSRNYIALLPDYGDVDETGGDQVLLDMSDGDGEDDGDTEGEED